MAYPLAADAEARHHVGATGRRSGEKWWERHRFVARGSDGGRPLVACQVAHVVAGPGQGGSTAAFQAALVRSGQAPVAIGEHGITMPTLGWELRASGLWADHICEQPMIHWSYGLEAFALAVDAPDELLHRGYGHRVPFGWELDFEAAADPVWSEPAPGSGGYEQAGTLHGLLLVGHDEIEIDLPAVRAHRWGPLEAADVGAGEAAEERGGIAADGVAIPTPAGPWWIR